MSFRDVLANELTRRKSRNPRYSLRAFARVLQLSAGHLSEVLRGSRNLSPHRAAEIARRLGYEEKRAVDFVAQASAETPSMLRTLELLADPPGSDAVTDAMVLDLGTISAIPEWYHFAILELTHCRGFRPEPSWVARKLGISVAAAKAALERLLRLGILRKERGTLVKVKGLVTSPSDVPSSAIRAFHGQMIEKARRALDSQAVDDRDVTGLTVAIDRAQMSEAKKEIAKFRRRMLQLLSRGRPSNVYQLNVQFFKLEEEDTE